MTDLDHVQKRLLAAENGFASGNDGENGQCFSVLYHFGEAQVNKERTRRQMSSPAVHVDLAKVVLVGNASGSTLRLVFPVRI
jgi:hypothetical protein